MAGIGVKFKGRNWESVSEWAECTIPQGVSLLWEYEKIGFMVQLLSSLREQRHGGVVPGDPLAGGGSACWRRKGRSSRPPTRLVAASLRRH